VTTTLLAARDVSPGDILIQKDHKYGKRYSLVLSVDNIDIEDPNDPGRNITVYDFHLGHKVKHYNILGWDASSIERIPL